MNKSFLFLFFLVILLSPNFISSSYSGHVGIEIVSTSLHEGTGLLEINFSDTVNVNSVDPTKIHILEKSSPVGGFVLSASEFTTTVNSTKISFQLTETNRQTLIALTEPHLRFEPNALSDDSGNQFQVTFNSHSMYFVQDFELTNETTTPWGILMGTNGTKLLVIDGGDNEVLEYHLTTPFDISTATITNSTDQIISFGSMDIRGIVATSDGLNIFMIGSNAKIVHFTLTDPYDMSTADPDNPTGEYSLNNPGGTNHVAMAISSDASHLYVLDGTKDEVIEYIFGTPLDVTTLNPTANPMSLLNLGYNAPHSVEISPDGSYLTIMDSGDTRLVYIPLNPLFTIPVNATSIDDFIIESNHKRTRGMSFSGDGAQLFFVEITNTKTVAQYLTGGESLSPDPDNIPPTVTSSLYDPFTGALTMYIDELIINEAPNDILLTNIYLSEVGGTNNNMPLTGSNITTIGNATTIDIILTDSQKQQVNGYEKPHLAMTNAALTDISGSKSRAVLSVPVITLGCSLDILLTPLNFGLQEPNIPSVEQTLLVKNNGFFSTQVYINGTDWEDTQNGRVEILGSATRYSLTSGQNYDSMNPLPSILSGTGLFLNSTDDANLYLKVKPVLLDSEYNETVTQDINIVCEP